MEEFHVKRRNHDEAVEAIGHALRRKGMKLTDEQVNNFLRAFFGGPGLKWAINKKEKNIYIKGFIFFKAHKWVRLQKRGLQKRRLAATMKRYFKKNKSKYNKYMKEYMAKRRAADPQKARDDARGPRRIYEKRKRDEMREFIRKMKDF